MSWQYSSPMLPTFRNLFEFRYYWLHLVLNACIFIQPLASIPNWVVYHFCLKTKLWVCAHLFQFFGKSSQLISSSLRKCYGIPSISFMNFNWNLLCSLQKCHPNCFVAFKHLGFQINLSFHQFKFVPKVKLMVLQKCPLDLQWNLKANLFKAKMK